MMRKPARIMAVLLVCGMMLQTACSVANTTEKVQTDSVSDNSQNMTATSEDKVSEAEEGHVYDIEKKKITMYVSSPEDSSEIELAFMDGAADIPYISVEGFKDMIISIMRDNDVPDYDLKYEADNDKVILTRESGYSAVLDFSENTIEFLDYDAFLKKYDGSPLMDVTALTGFNEKGEPELLQMKDTSFERYGDPVIFRPGDYGIDLISQEGEYYIPIQLVSDLILSHYAINSLYNGECLCWVGNAKTAFVEDQYYIADPPKERSDALIDFNYRELCFALDALYGLKEQHNIKDFDTLFKETGLIEPLMSKNPQEAGQALADLTTIYLDDKHTAFTGRSYMMNEPPKLKYGPSIQLSFDDSDRYSDAREKYYPDGVPGYEEVGNTAYITFDRYNFWPLDFYNDDKAEDNLDNTVALMIHAFSQITREGSPVENVVLDMSKNGGGSADAAAYVLGAFIGTGSISVMNPLSGALVTENITADLNLDRKFDDNDNLLNYNLFCMISPNSFSCGNMVPSVLKNSHRVTMLGQTSGGGACIVHYLSTADGCPFQISGPIRMSYTKNGSFYDIDQGVEPDFVIPDPDMFYDRKYMTDYINGLMKK